MRVLSFILLVIAQLGLAQAGTIRGRVVSKSDATPIENVNVILQGTVRTAVTNSEGAFIFSELPAGEYSLVFSVVGYQRTTRVAMLAAEGQTVEINVELLAAPINTEPIIITASKREQSLDEVPVSVSVMDASAIRRRNSIAVDEALRYVPGVNITESQVNIRGSSGYSRGAGSRVLMLVDGIPFLTGDTGELNFETLPIGQVDRIEVVKGASSALYGSSALGGVINVLTREIGDNPETEVRTWGGFYDSPSFNQWEWGGGTRFLDGLSFSHSRKINNLGVMLYGSRITDDGYRRNDFKKRYNGYVKLRQDFSSSDAMTMTFNIFRQDRASFLYWKGLDHALVPPDVQLGDMVRSTRFFLASQYKHVSSENFFYTVKGMWFKNRWEDTIDTSSNNSRSSVVRVEFQGTWMTSTRNIVTFGVEGNIDRVEADLFGERSGRGLAAYVQNEARLTDDFTVTVGARFDLQDLDSLESSSQFNPKLGLVYRPVEGLAIRGSFGRGFRAPSVAEAFITTQISGLRIIPNPALQPERSYSYEVGASQTLGETVLFDAAAFQSDFSDLIEAGFNAAGQGQFSNVTKARVRGVETSAKIAFLEKALYVDVGYTYVYPEDRTKNDILKYRPRHVFHASMLGQFGVFSCGVDFRHLSRVERIDDEFVTLGIVKDGNERVAISVADMRLGVKLGWFGFPLTATLNVNNVLQYNYVELIGNIAPPRTYIISLDVAF